MINGNEIWPSVARPYIINIELLLDILKGEN